MKLKMIKEELPEDFVSIHCQAFKDFFLTSLGARFLHLYYTSLIKSNRGIVICLFDNSDNLIGFAAGTKKSNGFHKGILLSNLFSYFCVLLHLIISRPNSIIRLFKNLNKKNIINNDDGDYAELLSIAVPPNNNGKGYGKMLLSEFEKVSKSFGSGKVALTTDFYNNEGVLAFYKRSGYEIFYDFIAFPNRHMYKLIKQL